MNVLTSKLQRHATVVLLSLLRLALLQNPFTKDSHTIPRALSSRTGRRARAPKPRESANIATRRAHLDPSLVDFGVLEPVVVLNIADGCLSRARGDRDIAKRVVLWDLLAG